MKVKLCRKCKHHQRRTFSTYHQPTNYHAIGFSHAYGYCKKWKKRCADVRNCKVEKEDEDE